MILKFKMKLYVKLDLKIKGAGTFVPAPNGLYINLNLSHR